ncbi:MAG: hypothetical protein V4709_02395 [Pseudomonadota bacterium]
MRTLFPLLFSLLISAQAVAASTSVLTLDATQMHAPETFAEALPVSVDARHDGDWLLQGETLTWTHTIVVHGAQALALELEALHLPPGASLQIGDAQWQGPLDATTLFTRHQPGMQLLLKAQMPRAVANGFVLRMVQVQAAFRDPFASPAAVTAKAGSCAVNYSCTPDSAVQQWGRAVVALIVHNTATCTGTLMNNTATDARPYLLTAKHCYSSAGSTDPVRAAASLRMAWNAVASCGSPLASAWGGGATFTEGAVHRAQYGDSWLVELASRPPQSLNSWYAGFDAGDQPPAGALTGLHHAGGMQKQLLSAGTASRTTRLSSFLVGVDLLGWALAPQQGGAAAGASGSGLFDAQGKVIGTLSTGVACDAASPQLTYTRLAQAWAGDGTVSGSLKPWLAPASNATVLAGKSFSGVSLPPLVVAPATAVPEGAANTASDLAAGGSLSAGLLGLLLLACAVRIAAVKRLIF